MVTVLRYGFAFLIFILIILKTFAQSTTSNTSICDVSTSSQRPPMDVSMICNPTHAVLLPTSTPRPQPDFNCVDTRLSAIQAEINQAINAQPSPLPNPYPNFNLTTCQRANQQYRDLYEVNFSNATTTGSSTTTHSSTAAPECQVYEILQIFRGSSCSPANVINCNQVDRPNLHSRPSGC